MAKHFEKGKMVSVPSHSIIPERDIDKRPILECINLGISFGGLKAVDNFNLAIGRTEIAGLIGPNGAGKTTVFNLLTAVALLPFTGLLVKLSLAVVKDEPEHVHRHPELHTLDEHLYISPAMALSEANKAVAFMGRVAKENFVRCCDALISGDLSAMDKINSEEETLDNFADSADRFMIGLSKVVEVQADDRQVDMLLQTVPSFERVGDYGTNLLELVDRLSDDNSSFSDTAKRELELICSAVNEILTITCLLYTSPSPRD